LGAGDPNLQQSRGSVDVEEEEEVVKERRSRRRGPVLDQTKYPGFQDLGNILLSRCPFDRGSAARIMRAGIWWWLPVLGGDICRRGGPADVTKVVDVESHRYFTDHPASLSFVTVRVLVVVVVYYYRAYYKAVGGGGEEDSAGHVLKNTTSLGLCGLV
jgi:hypothetical protein